MMFALCIIVLKEINISIATLKYRSNLPVTYYTEKHGNKEPAKLPQNLKVIEEEAFEGTALASVTIPPNVIAIGERAFACNASLFDVFLPESMESIGENAFDRDQNLILKGSINSFAKEWAKRKGFSFVIINEIRRKKDSIPVIAYSAGKDEKRYHISGVRYGSCCKTDVQKTGRAENDLKVSFYTGKDSIYVRSRYFP